MKTVQPVFFSLYELIFFPTNIYRIICNSKIAFDDSKKFKSAAKPLKINFSQQKEAKLSNLRVFKYSIPVARTRFNAKSGDLSLRADRAVESREHVIIIGQGSQCLATFCGDQGISPRPVAAQPLFVRGVAFIAIRGWRDGERRELGNAGSYGPVFAVKFQRSIKHRSRAERYFIPSSLFPNQNFLRSTNARTRTIGATNSVHLRCSRHLAMDCGQLRDVFVERSLRVERRDPEGEFIRWVMGLGIDQNGRIFQISSRVFVCMCARVSWQVMVVNDKRWFCGVDPSVLWRQFW